LNSIEIQPVKKIHADWITKNLKDTWNGLTVVSREKIHRPLEQPGFVAVSNGVNVGLVTFRSSSERWEITTLNSLFLGVGVGTALIEAVRQLARKDGCRRLWLITTNDNTGAIRFFQKRGFYLKALYPEAINISRMLKPEIPSTGQHGIEIRDEIELELVV
jgi:ribosomal protein S18 acetylase RimI-like enzyme